MNGMSEPLRCDQCGKTIWPGDAGLATSTPLDERGDPIEDAERWHPVHNRCLDAWRRERESGERSAKEPDDGMA
jgi:hypothetical protein